MSDFSINIEEEVGLEAQPFPNLDAVIDGLLNEDLNEKKELNSSELIIDYFQQILTKIDEYPEDILFLVDERRLNKYVRQAGKVPSFKPLEKRAEHHNLDNLFQPLQKYGINWLVVPNSEQLTLLSQPIKKQPAPPRINEELDKLYELGITIENINSYFDELPNELQTIHYLYGVLKHLDSNLKTDRSVNKNKLKEIVSSFSDNINERQASVWIGKFMKKAEFSSEGPKTNTWYNLGETETIDSVFDKLKPKIKPPKPPREPKTNFELDEIYLSNMIKEVVHSQYSNLEITEWGAVQYVCGLLKYLNENLKEDKSVDKSMLKLYVSEFAGVSTRKAARAINEVISAANIPHIKSFKETWYDLTDKTESIDKVFEEFKPEPRKRNKELDELYETEITSDTISSYYELNIENWKTIHYVCAVLKHLSQNLEKDRTVDKNRLTEQISKFDGVSKQAATKAINDFFMFTQFAPGYDEFEDNRDEKWYKLGEESTIDTIFKKSKPKPIVKKRFSGSNERLDELYQSGIGQNIVSSNFSDSDEKLSVVHLIYGVLKHLDKNLYDDNRYVDVNSLRDLIASLSEDKSTRKATQWVNKFLRATNFKKKKSKGNDWYLLGDTETIDSVFEKLKPISKKTRRQPQEQHINSELRPLYKQIKDNGGLNPGFFPKDRVNCGPLDYIQAVLKYLSQNLKNDMLVDKSSLAEIIVYLKPDLKERNAKAYITRAMKKIGYEAPKIAGETWFELGDPALLENIVNKSKATRRKKINPRINYELKEEELDKYFWGLSIEAIPNNFDSNEDSELGVGEHLYNLFLDMYNKLGEDKLVDKKRIIDKLCEQTDISPSAMPLIFKRFVEGANLIYEKEESLYMLRSQEELNEGLSRLKCFWPNTLPNKLKEN